MGSVGNIVHFSYGDTFPKRIAKATKIAHIHIRSTTH